MPLSFSSITCTEEVLGGSPRIAGRRLAVGDIVSLVDSYGTLQEVTGDFMLTKDEVRQALLYCSSLKCKEDRPLVYCHNCSLRSEQEGPIDFAALEESSLDELTIVKSDNSIYLGSLEDYVEQYRGKDWWTIATDLLIDHKGLLD